MNSPNEKVICVECKAKWLWKDLLQGQNPFITSRAIYGCPDCYSIDQFTLACDEPGCWQEVCCGTPTPTGYRTTCGKHIPKELTTPAKPG